jgi:eukaryotic-like serine/threonine-protein kinase
MALPARVWTAGKVLLLVAALAATFMIFAVLAARVAVRARDVAVPNLVGQSLADATATANALELQLNVEELRRPDPQVPDGHVLGQEPPAGSQSRRQRSVRVWLSSGPRIARAPALVGESQRAAEIRIVQDGLQPGPVAEIRSALYPPDVVVAQDPSPGVETSEVRLLVNRGEDRASYVMPDLIGVNGDRAADLLRSQGFRVSITAQAAAVGLPVGIVTRQSPPGGYQVHPGDAISIEVSR